MKLPHHRKYIHGIFHAFPLFTPRQCAKCKHDFVRESMWRFVSGPFYGMRGEDYYICKECAPSKNVAHKVACELTTKPPSDRRFVYPR